MAISQPRDIAPHAYAQAAEAELVEGVKADRPNGGGRIAGLDGLRALAILIVFIGHYSVYIVPAHADLMEKVFPGMLGVALFFGLSGFLISTLLMREYKSTQNISLKNFYVRRLLRLSPALYIYVLTTFLAYLIVDKHVQIGDFLAAVFYVSNYYQIAHHTVLYYMPVWSLAIEEHFYILFPILLLTIMRWSPRAFVPALIGLVVVQFFWRYHVAALPNMDWHWIYWRTDTRLDSLLFGVLLAGVAGSADLGRVRAIVVSGPACIFAIALMVISVLDRNEFFRMSARYTIQGLALAMLIGYVVYNPGRIANICRRWLDAPVLVYIGQISYSLYLWHLTIVKFVDHVLGHVSPVLAIGLALLSLGVASVSYRFIEMPFLKLRHRFGSHAPA